MKTVISRLLNMLLSFSGCNWYIWGRIIRGFNLRSLSDRPIAKTITTTTSITLMVSWGLTCNFWKAPVFCNICQIGLESRLTSTTRALPAWESCVGFKMSQLWSWAMPLVRTVFLGLEIFLNTEEPMACLHCHCLCIKLDFAVHLWSDLVDYILQR